MERKHWIRITAGIAGAAVLAAGITAGVWLGRRVSVKKSVSDRYTTYVDKSLASLDEQRTEVVNRRDYIAMERQQIKGQKERVRKEIVKLQELLAHLTREED